MSGRPTFRIEGCVPAGSSERCSRNFSTMSRSWGVRQDRLKVVRRHVDVDAEVIEGAKREAEFVGDSNRRVLLAGRTHPSRSAVRNAAAARATAVRRANDGSVTEPRTAATADRLASIRSSLYASTAARGI